MTTLQTITAQAKIVVLKNEDAQGGFEHAPTNIRTIPVPHITTTKAQPMEGDY